MKRRTWFLVGFWCFYLSAEIFGTHGSGWVFVPLTAMWVAVVFEPQILRGRRQL